MCTYIQSCTCSVILVVNVVQHCRIICDNVGWWCYIEVAKLVQLCYNNVSCNVTMSENNVHRCVHVSSWCYNNVTMLDNDMLQCVTVSDKLAYMLQCYNKRHSCVSLDFGLRTMCNIRTQSVTMLHQCYDSVQQYLYVFHSYATISYNITWMSTQCQMYVYMRNNVQRCATVSTIILQSTTSIQPSYDVTTLWQWCASCDNTITLLHNTCLVLYTKKRWCLLMYNDISPSTNHVQWCACMLQHCVIMCNMISTLHYNGQSWVMMLRWSDDVRTVR